MTYVGSAMCWKVMDTKAPFYKAELNTLKVVFQELLFKKAIF